MGLLRKHGSYTRALLASSHPRMQLVELGRHHLRLWRGVRAISFFAGFKCPYFFRRHVGGRISKCSLFGDVMRLDSGLSGGGEAATQMIEGGVQIIEGGMQTIEGGMQIIEGGMQIIEGGMLFKWGG